MSEKPSEAEWHEHYNEGIQFLTEENARLRAENEVLRAFALDYADEPCAYGDNCTLEAMHKNHHYRCLPCKARAALAAAEKGEG